MVVSVGGLRAAVARLSRRGRNGVGVLRAYLDQRALGDRRLESALEPVMARLLVDRDVGPVEFQAILRLDGRTVRVDFLLPRPRIVVEVDGLAVHGSRDALDDDLERQNLLVRHGYLVLRYTVTHLRRPAQAAREIIGAARRRIDELQPVL